MNNTTVTMTASGYRFYPMLSPFPVAFFLGAFATDLVYWCTPDVMWETFSIWLITAGLILAGLSVVAGLLDLVGHRRNPGLKPAWLRVLATAVALLIALINAFVHSRDGYTAVVPTGLILSGVVVIVLFCTMWMGGATAYGPRVGAVN
jgi:uncharacterized membrane protein